MDYFALLLDGICLLGQGVMHILFVSRLTGKKLKPLRFAVYILLLIALQLVAVRISLSGTLSIAACVLELYAVSRFWMGNQPSVSWLASVLACYISQLSFGILNSLESMVFPEFIGNSLLYPLLLAAQIVFFIQCFCCCRAVCRFLDWGEDGQTPYIGLLLFPGLFSSRRNCIFSRLPTAFLPPSPLWRKSEGTVRCCSCKLWVWRRCCAPCTHTAISAWASRPRRSCNRWPRRHMRKRSISRKPRRVTSGRNPSAFKQRLAEGFLFYTPISAARSRAASMLGAKLSSPTRSYMPDF